MRNCNGNAWAEGQRFLSISAAEILMQWGFMGLIRFGEKWAGWVAGAGLVGGKVG